VADGLFTPRFTLATAANVIFFVGVTSFLALPVHLTDLGANRADVGHVMGSFGLASLIAIPITGALSDRFGRRRFMLAGALSSAVFAIAWLWVKDIGPLPYVLRFGQGIGFSLAFVAVNAVLVDLAPPQSLGRSIALFGAMTLISHAVGPTLGEWVAAHFGFRWVFWLSGIAFVISSGLFLALPDTRPLDLPPPSRPDPNMLGLALRRGAVGALVAAFMTAITFGCAIQFMAVFVRERGLSSHAPFFVSYVGAAICVRLVAGGLGDRVGHRRVSAIACLGFALVASGFAGLTTQLELYVLAIGFGLSHGLTYPSANALFLEHAPNTMRGRGMALFNLAFNVGVTVAGFGAGEIAERVSWSAMWLTAAAAALVGSLALFLDRRPLPSVAG
jgi:MFS family permease